MRASFTEDHNLGQRLFDLLDEVFPGLRAAKEEGARLGASWESVSTPFVLEEKGRVVAHVGLIGLPLVVMGRPTTVGSVHAVATRADRRRRGLCRRLMEEMLAYAEGRYETLVLTTEHPEYYTPFGFRVLQEHRFTVRPRPRPRCDGLRVLDLAQASDVALLNRLLDGRSPVSEVVCVGREKAVFCVNEGRRPLHYIRGLDALLCMKREGATLELFDVVAPDVPDLEEILARVVPPVERVILNFSPDKLSAEAAAEPHRLDHDGESYLMARGPFAAEGRPFTLPRSART
jgi:N-acetylglutamate synthase-like GNAT family acetyltransferase